MQFHFIDQCPHDIETSQLICRANHLTGFCMIGTLVVKELTSGIGPAHTVLIF